MNAEDIQQIFFVECEESLEAAEAGLDELKAGTHDDETINAIFRAVHSIKGGAGAFGYVAMQGFTHTFETLLADVREGAVAAGSDLVDLFLLALDCLRDHVDAAQSGGDAPDDAALIDQLTQAQAVNAKPEPSDAAQEEEAGADQAGNTSTADQDLDALLDELMAGGDTPKAAGTADKDGKEPAGWTVQIRPHAGAMINGNEPLLWLRELTELGGECQECHLTELPALDEMNVEEGYLSWTFLMPADAEHAAVADIFDFAGDNCTVTYGEQGATNTAATDTATAAPEPIPTPVETTDTKAAAAPKAAPPSEAKSAEVPAKAEATPPTKPAAEAPVRKQTQAQVNQSVRVDLGKLDKLIDGVGELVIAQAMLTQRLANESLAHIEELSMLDTLVRDIQEHAMAFRAQPISSVFSRVPRLLRELAGTTGKHVKLEISGETTELDKTVIERLSEPLTHLIRNAIDHGVEGAEERKEAGKDPEGTLSLSAEQKAGRILIRIGDDGRGIDREKLRNKAIANGVVDPDTQMSDEDVYNLVFAPGLSTAQSVSNISGRGVGMDVVRQNVKELGGRITIESCPGTGTTFTLALPLTLAISDGMIVQVGEESLVIPLAHVVESLRPIDADLKGMGSGRQLLNVRGQFVPIVPLRKIAGSCRVADNPSTGVLVVVETESHGCAALLVDAITDQRQFVIKSLDTHYRTVDSVAGATILGNGRVALIVDVDHLVQSEATSAASALHPPTPSQTAAEAELAKVA